MNSNDFLQFIIFVLVLILLTPPLGAFMADIFEGKKTWAHTALGWLENLTYKISGIDPNVEMTWKAYAGAFLIFHFGRTTTISDPIGSTSKIHALFVANFLNRTISSIQELNSD